MFPSLVSAEVKSDRSAELTSLDRFSGELGQLALVCLELEPANRRDWIRRRVERMGKLMQSFGEVNFPQGVHDSVYLYEITSALDLNNLNLPQEKLNKRRELAEEYLTQADLSNDEFDLVFSVLHDLSYMDNEANSYRSHPNMYEDGIDSRFKNVIQDSYNQEIIASDWLVSGKKIDVSRMREVLGQVNIESVVIKAMQLLDDLRKSQEHSPVELLHKVNEAEYFYAPICEIIGYDGLAMALRDKALQIRFVKSGQNEALRKAWEVYGKIGNNAAERALSLLGNDSDSCVFIAKQVAGQMDGEPNIVDVGDFIVDFPGTNGGVLGSYRIKTVGSIAEKIVRKPEYKDVLPMDLVGLTFILEDEADIDLVVYHTLLQLKDKVDFLSTPNKESPLYIQTTEGRASRLGRLMTNFGEDVQTRVVDDGEFQVAKMTFVMRDQPDVSVEMQFLTKSDRKAARVGQNAHILYKYGKDLSPDEMEQLIGLMSEINERRKHMVNPTGKITVKRESLERAWRQYNLAA